VEEGVCAGILLLLLRCCCCGGGGICICVGCENAEQGLTNFKFKCSWLLYKRAVDSSTTSTCCSVIDVGKSIYGAI